MATLTGIVRRRISTYRAWRAHRRAAAELQASNFDEFEDSSVAPVRIDLAAGGENRRSGRPTVNEYLKAIDDMKRPTWPRFYRNF